MTAKMAIGPAVLLLTVGLSGCGHGVLRPAPTAHIVSSESRAAYSQVDGVRCAAEAGAWGGRTGDLTGDIVPLKVWVENRSGRAIRLLAQDFVLVGKSGRSYRPIPVLPLGDGEGPAPPHVEPMYAGTKFYVAPRLHGVYATLEPWRAPLQRDEDLYDRQFRRWGKQHPTVEMLRMALPEGVLDDGGMISGFLYFEDPRRGEDRLTFEADFGRDDGSGTVAAIEIPFRVD
jgi:hypothetical protein